MLISREEILLKGGNDSGVKWRCDMSLTKYGKSECDEL